MAIKAGQILHVMNRFVIDRIQTAGAGNLNIPTEKIHELGNFQSVAIVRDVPDLTFTLDSLDVGTEVEALLTGSSDPGTDTFGDGSTGQEYDLSLATPIDIISPMKSAQGAFDIVKGVAVPHLTLESASYRYGLNENAGENFSLRGDAIFYIPGTPYLGEFTGDGSTTNFSFNDGSATPTPLTALKYVEQGVDIYALNVSVDGVRQVQDVDFTDTSSGITFATAPANGADIRVTFGSSTSATYDQSVHQGVSVKPAAIKGKDIQVFVGDDGSPIRWTDVQSVNVDWRVTLEDDFEFGNPRAVSRDFADVPEVTGSIEIKPANLDAWFNKLQDITGVPATEIVGPQSSVSLPIEIRLLNPDSGGTTAYPAGQVLKTLYVPDARFTIPGYEGRAQQKYVTTIDFESDSGSLKVYKGEK